MHKKSPSTWGQILRVASFLVVVGIPVAALCWWGWSSWRGGVLWEEARTAAEEQRWDEAEAALARLNWYRPGDPEVLKRRIQLALSRQDYSAAADLLAVVPESDPEIERARMSRGRLLMELHRFREAEQVFRRCTELNPGLAEAWIQLIVLSGMKRQGRRFEEDLWSYFRNCGQPIPALRLLARGIPMLPDKVTVDQAIDEGLLLERALRADPEDLEVRPPLARYYLERGDVPSALAVLEPWLADHPDDIAARVEWLACQLDQGEAEALAPWFDSALTRADDSGRYAMLRGDWLSREGRHEEAAESFLHAARIDQRDPQPRYRLAMALRALGRDADAAAAPLEWVQNANRLKSLIHQVTDADPNPSLLVEAGRLCAAMGREREARGWLTLALVREPNNPEVRRLLEGLGG